MPWWCLFYITQNLIFAILDILDINTLGAILVVISARFRLTHAASHLRYFSCYFFRWWWIIKMLAFSMPLFTSRIRALIVYAVTMMRPMFRNAHILKLFQTPDVWFIIIFYLIMGLSPIWAAKALDKLLISLNTETYFVPSLDYASTACSRRAQFSTRFGHYIVISFYNNGGWHYYY